MKKILIATSALALSAGVAAAEVKVGGYGYVGIVYDGADAAVIHRIRLEFTGSTTTSAGTSFSAYVRMDNDAGCLIDGNLPLLGGNCDANFGNVTRARITVKHDNITFAAGSTNGAMRTLARSATFYGFNDGGIIWFDNNVSSHTDGSGTVAMARYDAGAFSVAASTTLTGSSQEISARYSANGFTIGAGASTDSRYMVMAGYTMGDIGVTVGYGNGPGVENIVGAVSYTMGDWNFGAGVASYSGAMAYGLDVGYNLGGGTRLSATVGSSGGATVVGAGVLFRF